jgi:kynurenine formamidase
MVFTRQERILAVDRYIINRIACIQITPTHCNLPVSIQPKLRSISREAIESFVDMVHHVHLCAKHNSQNNELFL